MVASGLATALAAALAVAGCTVGEEFAPELSATCGAVRRPSQCGSTLDFTPINQYRDDLVVVHQREDAVALINGTCSGTLIAAGNGPIVLTAGHCAALGDPVVVAFNVEADPDGDTLVTGGVVIEQATEPDYALVVLDRLPAVSPTLLTSRMTPGLAIIQHPRGGPKVVAEGRLSSVCGDARVAYGDLDTLVGSSGAGVLTERGHLLAVHTDGDCAEDGTGANRGWTARHIVEASAYLVSADLADR
jgi:hypothetical protein